MFDIRTDLTIEAHEIYMENASEKEKEAPGIKVEEDGNSDIHITRVQILNETGEKALGKSIGEYVTLEIPSLKENQPDIFDKCAVTLKKELSNLIKIQKNKTTLVVGLGNRDITPDSLGPKAITYIAVTRHLFSEMPSATEGFSPVCALSPGVLGITGIETGEIIKGVADKVKPDLIIAIDALASRSMDRVGTTIQISDTGISPGSGVGNNRKSLSKETLGSPVIAIGVPMVIDAATIANDTMDKILDMLIAETEESSDFYKMLKNFDREKKHRLIKEISPNKISGMLVTPKEIDEMTDRIAQIVAGGINMCLHEKIGIDNMLTN